MEISKPDHLVALWHVELSLVAHWPAGVPTPAPTIILEQAVWLAWQVGEGKGGLRTVLQAVEAVVLQQAHEAERRFAVVEAYPETDLFAELELAAI